MAIKVSSRDKAWELADKLFPTDYMKDEESSGRAGYPIYESTAENGRFAGAWISDLNCTLELNIPGGIVLSGEYFEDKKNHTVDTIRIDIVEETKIPVIREKDTWNGASLMRVCQMHGYYNAGTVEQYNNLILMAEKNPPDKETLYLAAKDICEHTKNIEGNLFSKDSIPVIMGFLKNEAVHAKYEVEE